MPDAMTLLSNKMLRNSTEDLLTTEMRGRHLCLLIYSPYSLSIYRVFWTSSLPRATSCFSLWNETETEANTTKANSAKRCRSQSGHLNFDIYIAKTQTPTVWLRSLPSWFCERVCIHDVIHWCFSLLDIKYNHDDLEETQWNWPPELPTWRPCMLTLIIKFMIYYTISSAHPADASDMNRSDYTLVSVVNQRHSCLKVELRSLVSYDFSRGCSKKTRARTYGYAAPVIPVSCLQKDGPSLSPTFDGSAWCPMN